MSWRGATEELQVPRAVARTAAPLDDRWPDRFAAVMYAFAAFTVVVSSLPDWRAYFSRPEDVVSALTIPVFPSLAYAALLAVMGAALRRRIPAAWWLAFVWWLLLPEIARVAFLAEDWDLASVVGLVLVAAAMVLAWRVRYQFVVHRVAGSLRTGDDDVRPRWRRGARGRSLAGGTFRSDGQRQPRPSATSSRR